MSQYIGKIIGMLSTASPVLLFEVSSEVALLGAMVIVTVEEKFSTTAIPVGVKFTHRKHELASAK